MQTLREQNVELTKQNNELISENTLNVKKVEEQNNIITSIQQINTENLESIKYNYELQLDIVLTQKKAIEEKFETKLKKK